MVPLRASKHTLTPLADLTQPSTVSRLACLAIASAVLVAGPLGAQAPPAAGLWRVATSSLAVPAALQQGAVSAFWNPSGPNGGRSATVGVEVLHTANILGLTGILGGASIPVAGSFRAGFVIGRMQVRDLVRTTTSPDNEEGTVPVYEQMGGVSAAWQVPRLHVGATAAFHHAKFDVESSSGLTLDIGFRAQPFPRLTIAGATHFLPITLGDEPTTDYFGGAEYEILHRRILSGLRTCLGLQYGAAYRSSGDLEHTVNIAMTIEEQLLVDVALTRESAYGQRDWRPSLAVGLQFGRYMVRLAHGAGVNDVGGTFRVGLTVQLTK
jgi:hypothetical protein